MVYEKKDNFQYSEKFSHHRVAPSVKSFGGRPLEGCLVVSATGMVGVIVLLKDAQNITLQSVSESLGAVRNRITSADICYGKSEYRLLNLLNVQISIYKCKNPVLSSVCFLFNLRIK